MAEPTSNNSSPQLALGSRKVLITGVSKGLGRALALELASRGHTIIGCSRGQTKLDSLQAQLSNLSSTNHLLYNVDVVCHSPSTYMIFSRVILLIYSNLLDAKIQIGVKLMYII